MAPSGTDIPQSVSQVELEEEVSWKSKENKNPEEQQSPEVKQVEEQQVSEQQLHLQQNAEEEGSHHHDEESEAEDCLHSKIGYSIKELILICVWVVLVGLYIWYLVELAITVDYGLKNPTTSVSYVEQIPKELPMVTVCNWNSGYYCGEKCNLTLVHCSTVDADGSPIPCIHQPRYIQIEQQGNLFHCYQYNYDSKNSIKAVKTGYDGSVSLYFEFSEMPEEDRFRNGLQVTFSKLDSTPNVLDETNYAFHNLDNFFSLTHVVVETLKPNDNHQPIYWDVNYSSIEISFENTTVVSFCYSSLNTNDIREVRSYDGFDLFAKVCEMLLILVGLDIIKVVRGILLIPDAIRRRTFKEIFETFI